MTFAFFFCVSCLCLLFLFLVFSLVYWIGCCRMICRPQISFSHWLVDFYKGFVYPTPLATGDDRWYTKRAPLIPFIFTERTLDFGLLQTETSETNEMRKVCATGQWGSWGSWSSCSVSCGGSTQHRSRVQLVPQAGRGLPCEGTGTTWLSAENPVVWRERFGAMAIQIPEKNPHLNGKLRNYRWIFPTIW